MATVTIEQWRLAQKLALEIEAIERPILTQLEGCEQVDEPAALVRRERMVGTVLGAAIGDALGHPTEFIRSLTEIRARYGELGVTGYELYWERNGQRFAPYTDDTQLAEAVLRTLVWSRASAADLPTTMQHMARRFVNWAYDPQGGHRAPGNATLAGCRLLGEGVPWDQAGADDAGGCGSVMRAYPFGLVFWDDVEKAERWAVEHSRLTHGAPIALAACAAMAVATALLTQGATVERSIEGSIAAARRWDVSTANMLEQAYADARSARAPDVVLQHLQGWAAHEAIAAAVYVFARHSNDFSSAVLEAANTPGDSDSIATLAGALCGAALGQHALPTTWVDDLERSAALAQLAQLAHGAARAAQDSSR